jgi:hypothetical protein
VHSADFVAEVSFVVGDFWRCEAIGDGAEHDGWSGSTTRGLVNPPYLDFELTKGSRRLPAGWYVSNARKCVSLLD